jgi:hypothetical protein
MNEYHLLLYRKERLNNDIKSCKKRLHEEYMGANKRKIMWMDLIVCILVFLNFMSAYMTEYLVFREKALAGEEIILMEANPVVAQSMGYEQHPDGMRYIKVLFRTGFSWALLGAVYFYFRSTLFTDEGYYIMVAVMLWYAVMIGLDFSNNLGILLAKWIYM